MAKFYTTSSQARELNDEAKALRTKNKELKDELLLKKGEGIRLTEELTRLHGIEKELWNQVEELKTDSIEKETHICYFEGKCQELTSSLENARKDAIATYMNSSDFTNRLDQNYVACYEIFALMPMRPILGWNSIPSKFLLQQKAPCFK